MLNYFAIIFATVGIVLLFTLLLEYSKFRKRGIPGLRECLWIIVAVLAVMFLTMASLFITNAEVLMFLAPLIWAFIILCNTLCYMVIVSLLGSRGMRFKKILRFTYAMPVLMAILAFFNPQTHWMIEDVVKQPDGFGYIVQYGAFYNFIAAYSVCIIFIVLIFAIYVVTKSPARGRGLLWMAFATALIPQGIGALQLILPPLQTIQLLNISFWITALLITSVFYGYLRTARGMAISNTDEIYIVFDRWGVCVDTNTAARAFFQKHFSISNPSLQVLSETISKLDLSGQDDFEFTLKDGDSSKYYRATSFRVSHTISQYYGFGFLIREVTEFQEQLNALNTLATEDPLTGIKNRRYFYAYAEDLFKRIQSQGGSSSLLMLDLDFFKHVNDTYGHLAGDEVLIEFCNLCKKLLRNDDVFCRLGGEEFAIVVEGSDHTSGSVLATRILETIRHTSLPTSEGPQSITVSIGGCTLYKDAYPNVEQWVDAADQMLYKAKQNGRDRLEYEI
jgi:diguanylate cyclase (GGDEF)-like protein